MTKRASPSESASSAKRQKLSTSSFNPRKITTAEIGASVDANPPLSLLLQAVANGAKKHRKGDCVVYWMRMGDLRVTDNRALSLASRQARDTKTPLVALFVLSPQDYIAHDRSARRIDFCLRNLALIKSSLADLHIPLYTVLQPNRRRLPSKVVDILDELNASAVFGNIEYEVDELRRDVEICDQVKEKNVGSVFVHDKCVVEPGVVQTKEARSYAVYTPYQKVWLSKLNADITHYLENYPMPAPNLEDIRKHAKFGPLFDVPVPDSVAGFALENGDRKMMEKVWPAGEDVASKARAIGDPIGSSQLGAVDPLAKGAEESDKRSRLAVYGDERDRADRDTTSRIRQDPQAGTKVNGGRDSSVGRWVQEVAWRDFYVNILAGFPRVSMGRPFLEKYSEVVWEGPVLEGAYEAKNKVDTKETEEMIEKWKQGKTGYPIVDAGMRCMNEMGWMHNRLRMICAMFLTKDLMVDWRVGEEYFAQNLIDADLASNNGGWQWSASTGVDPCPYFRIFNPYSQSPKADPAGDFIRHWVPELAKLHGPDVHKPSASAADKLGYPRPIVQHDQARARALRRFKDPGTM
ncbi:unnamed protein product [Mycena citricolor]|uniref:Photolyase/cryptochrome alpha/beta domain-containing protein n=1 Tax=Mycena citricolor TaxID=2018698 RepID=A0AAD2HI70_9AGAR|nr:unnamed protein product [Mycena citricolor]